MPTIAFAEFRPDVADLNGSFTGDVNNVLCADGSYIPFPQFKPLSQELPSACLGGFMARDDLGGTYIFAGTATGLYRLDNTDLGWVNISKTGTQYNASREARWSFAQFGAFVIAVNENDNPQVIELGQALFRDLGGNPPRAAIVRVWGDFVALMGLPAHPRRVWWSGLNDAEHWTVGAKNCDYQEFPDGGVVQGSTEATNPLVFQEKAIRRVTFVPGSVEIFTFQKIHDQRGARSRLSIASRANLAFYADEGGFFQIAPDGSMANIGFEKVDRTVFDQVEWSDTAEIMGVVDPFYSRVYFAIRRFGNENYNQIYIYDWALSRWTKADITASMLMSAATLGYTLEGLDAVSTSIDALPYSLDARSWQGGSPVLAAFTRDGALGFFNGQTQEAVITTQEIGDTTGGVTRIHETYLIADTDDARLAIGSRFRRSEAFRWQDEQAPSSRTGMYRRMSRSRFHKVKVRIPAGSIWTHAQGIETKISTAGMK